MNVRTILILGIAFGTLGCAEKKGPGQDSAMESAQTATAEMPDVEAIADEASESPDAWRDSAFLDHMHAHAEHLDDLNYALDDGNLDRAMTAAYWLSNHKTVSGLPSELESFVDGMRDAARAVEEAADIDAARAAAKQIGGQCQACHEAVGVTT